MIVNSLYNIVDRNFHRQRGRVIGIAGINDRLSDHDAGHWLVDMLVSLGAAAVNFD